ncbi:hypothetical protein L596_008125 [Steinernema carpocapsae]|uniref:Uncharacterized protein n=1 Tax=Steinernema carpocapsae TaxID=34508 RepID=A0A4U5PBH2_STECR|nr:hypothetical protein L596_008125 [Steinernema carpocapsae]
MPRVVPLLASFCLCAATIAVAAPTLQERSNTVIQQRSSPAKAKAKLAAASAKKRRSPPAAVIRTRRSKREVYVEEIPDDLPFDTVSDQIRGLSDNQLQLLAEIVQNEINNYDPEQNLDEYEIVEVPIDFGRNDVELFPRDRRGVQIVEDDEPPLLVLPEPLELEPELDEPELVLVPEELLEEAEDDIPEAAMPIGLDQEDVDDIELRLRISELANLLNERAIRGL